MQPRLVQDFLENSARHLPGKTCLVCGGERLTYASVDSSANRLANGLLSLGLQRGDRVGLYLPNSAALVVGIFAVLKAGGVFVVINPSTKADKLAAILSNCQARILVTGDPQAELAGTVATQAPAQVAVVTVPGKKLAGAPGVLSMAFDTIQRDCPDARPPQVCIDQDLACLIYTSGSTGEPKGVMSAHANVIFAVQSITEYLENREDDIVIDVLPLSFDYGLYQLLMTFSFGGTLVLEKGFTFPAQVLSVMERERVTGFPGVPTLYTMLLGMDLSKYNLSSIRYLTNTAAALPTRHILDLRQKFPQARLYSMYGLTETKRTLYLPPEELDRRPDSVGIAIPGTEVWLEDEDGNRVGPGGSGELVVRGRHVMRGYWGDEVLSAARFRPGPLPGEMVCYSGDIFRMDAEGFLYFVARKDDVLKVRGEKVPPREVENVLYKLDGVREAAVIGVPDEVLGQAVKAFIVPSSPDLTEAEVLHHCRSNLEDFMVPRYITFVPDLPKTASGKINKRELQQPAA